ncbi:MAG: PhoU domain-containing protein [Nitrososphaerota archaeon]
MDVRKLQTTVGGTYVVTLPRELVSSLGLSRGDMLSVHLENDRIVLAPTVIKPPSQSRTIRIEDFPDPKMLELAIVNLYIMGHDLAEIVSNGSMRLNQKKSIRTATDGLMGVEIIEDYSDRVVLQTLVDPSKFEVNSLLIKFSTICRAVLDDALKSLEVGDRSLASDAFERGLESTRLYRLMMRICFQALRNIRVRDDVKVPDLTSLVVRIIAVREMGRIAYYSMKVAERVAELDTGVHGEIVDGLSDMGHVVVEMQEKAIKALVEHDPSMASEVIDRMSEVRELYERLYRIIIRRPEREAYILGLIIRAVRAVAGYAVALADDAILEAFSR